MNQIFKDYEEIKHIVNGIEEEWCQPWDPWDSDRACTGAEMATAHMLADRLRQELIGDGNVMPEQIADANEIVFGFLDKDVFLGMWQYAFADCLAELLTDFDEPYGVPATDKARLDVFRTLKALERKCVEVLFADLARIRDAKVHALAPLARMGKSHSAQQSQRAKKPRSTLTKLIKSLVHQHPEETAKELWPHLFSALEEEQLKPKEIAHLDKWKFEYTFNNSRKTISFGRFSTIIASLKSR